MAGLTSCRSLVHHARIELAKCAPLPQIAHSSCGFEKNMQAMRIDDFDLRLLDALQDDGRLSNQELADRVGLSASQCSRRRAALEEAGIIAGYRAALSSDALGLELIVFIEVSMARHSPENAVQFGQLLEHMEEVQEAYSLTGEADYLIKLAIPNLKPAVRNPEQRVPAPRGCGTPQVVDRSRSTETNTAPAARTSAIVWLTSLVGNPIPQASRRIAATMQQRNSVMESRTPAKTTVSTRQPLPAPAQAGVAGVHGSTSVPAVGRWIPATSAGMTRG